MVLGGVSRSGSAIGYCETSAPAMAMKAMKSATKTMATKAMKAIQAKTATKTMSTDRATKAKTPIKTMSTRAMKVMKAKTALKTMSKKAKKTTGGLKKQDLTTLKAKKGMKTTNAMKSAGTQAVSPKRFRAANPPHDHDDKTNYHDDDLIKYQWKSCSRYMINKWLVLIF